MVSEEEVEELVAVFNAKRHLTLRQIARAAIEELDKVRESKAKQTLNEVLDFFAARKTHPGNWWAFTDDGTEFCLDYQSPMGGRFWLDLTRQGTIQLLWRAPGSKEAQSFTFKAAAIAGKDKSDETP